MKRYTHRWIALAGVAALFAAPALAERTIAIMHLPKTGEVTLSGVIDNVISDREFTLRDDTGAVVVKLTTSQQLMLEQGKNVIITGLVNSGLTSTSVNATQVSMPTTISQEQAVITPVAQKIDASLENADHYPIAELPRKGLVKIVGQVTDIASEKEFTLQDESGSIPVEIHSPKSVLVVVPHTRLTVTGYMKDPAMGNPMVSARHVVVDATIAANPEE